MENTEGRMSIAQLRGKRHATQRELADLIGVTEPTYRSKEKGLTEFTLGEARKICKHLNFPFADITDGERD